MHVLIRRFSIRERLSFILLPAWAIGTEEAPQRLENICTMIPEIKVF